MSYIHPPKKMPSALLLAPDNFTPAARTPWGGTKIVNHYKPFLDHRGGVVGESWEVSVEPDFPSRVGGSDDSLADVIAREPSGMLGREAALGRTSTALLVKLLDAAEDLSVQIHPDDGFAGLAPDEAGKPESWYVLEREPGATLYLGLAPGVTRDRMADTLASGGDVSGLLHRVEVEPGDFFVIAAGTAHAIGRGITLVEPQHVAPGKRGVTYRYWDWNRRYAPDGRPDPDGEPRTLHAERALAVTEWDAPRGEGLLRRIRGRAGVPDREARARLEPLCGPAGGVPSDHLDVRRLCGSGGIDLPDDDRLRGLTVVDGRVEIGAPGEALAVERGRSAVLPASVRGARCRLEGAHALLCAVVPRP